MGIRSFHFVAIASVLISIALTIQLIIELNKFQAANFAGAAISIGLLRELGPLTISVAWCARVAALISEEARDYKWKWPTDQLFAENFILPRYLATLAMSVPLGAYGLVIGFITAAVVAPMLGGISINDFLESAWEGIKLKDVLVYFIKLIGANPTIAFFAGCTAGLAARNSESRVATNAVTATFLGCFALNLAITVAAYLFGEPN